MKRSIILLILILVISAPSEAQILKKLKNKIEKKEQDKASEKAADDTGNMMGDTNAFFPMGGEQVNPAEVPAEYDFTWKYNAQIKTTQGNMNMLYRLKKDAHYMGIEMQQAQNVFMVMDSKNDLMVMFMESGQHKMLMASRLDPDQAPSNEDFYKDAEIRKLGKKILLGYNCQGYEVETQDHLIKFYITNEADVSFTQFYQYENDNLPPGLKEEWLENGEGLMMEMEMIDKKNPKNNAAMICTALEKEPFRIKKSNYQSMYGN